MDTYPSTQLRKIYQVGYKVQRQANHRSWDKREQTSFPSAPHKSALGTHLLLTEIIRLVCRQLYPLSLSLVSQKVTPGFNALNINKLGIKRQVLVDAHLAVQVIWNSERKLLRFSKHNAFAGLLML